MLHPFFVVGPTASGKTALAIELARRSGGEIVNADAFQLYAGLDVLTAKPTQEEMNAAPHHLFGVLPQGRAFDAAAYEALANTTIREIASRGNLPIVVGGSGLYVKTLTHGLSPLPPGNEMLRAQLGMIGHAACAAWLAHLDPGFTDLANPRYTTRGLEIAILTGQRPTDLKRSWSEPPPNEVAGIQLSPPRDLLYQRINTRVIAMVEEGALDEVASFPGDATTAAQAIGVAEFRAHLAGELPLDEAIDAVQRSTRRFAKRQLTWFKKERQFLPIGLTEFDGIPEAGAKVAELFPTLFSES